MKELVSIVIPTYNAERTIDNTIQSILNQSYKNFELIIIDDSSIDNTTKEILKYKDPRIQIFINKSNKGVAYSRNRGVKQANGRYIAFCDSDDYWDPEKLHKQVPFLKKYPVVCSNYYMVDDNYKILKEIKGLREINYQNLLLSNQIPNSSAIFDRVKTNKGVVQKEIGHEDYLMWLKLLHPDKIAYRIQEPLMYYRVHNNSLSSNKLKAIFWTWNIYNKELKLNYVFSFFYLSSYILTNIKKHYLKKS